jgi:hypothetical protein
MPSDTSPFQQQASTCLTQAAQAAIRGTEVVTGTARFALAMPAASGNGKDGKQGMKNVENNENGFKRLLFLKNVTDG